MKRIILIAVALATAFLATSNAEAYRRPVNLTILTVTQWAVGHEVKVTVTPGTGSWGGSASPGMPYLYIGRDAFRDAQHGGGHGLSVLLHELGHTTGITNEHETDCYALDHVKPALVELWHMSEKQAQAQYLIAVGFQNAQSDDYGCIR